MASYIFKCPLCKEDIESQDEWVGLESPCPLCLKDIVIPPPPAPTAPPPSPVPSAPPPPLDAPPPPVASAGPTSFKKKILYRKIMDMPNLPTLPSNMLTILSYLRDDNIEMNKVVGAINRDQVLVAQILKVVNSGYYSLRSTINSVDHAINLVGFQRIKELLYSASLLDIMTGSEEQLWLHSYSSYCLVQDLIKKENIRDVSPGLPLTMLMHDIGRVIMGKLNPTTYKMALTDSQSNRLPLHKTEQRFLDADHAEVGGWLMERWNMTEDAIIPVASHHSDVIPPKFLKEVALVQVADWIDSHARDMTCLPPSKELLKKSGFDRIDMSTWEASHGRLIAALDASSPIVKKPQRS